MCTGTPVYACDFDCNSSHWHAQGNKHASNGWTYIQYTKWWTIYHLPKKKKNIHEYPIRENDVVVAFAHFVARFRTIFAFKFFSWNFLNVSLIRLLLPYLIHLWQIVKNILTFRLILIIVHKHLPLCTVHKCFSLFCFVRNFNNKFVWRSLLFVVTKTEQMGCYTHGIHRIFSIRNGKKKIIYIYIPQPQLN